MVTMLVVTGVEADPVARFDLYSGAGVFGSSIKGHLLVGRTQRFVLCV